MPGQSGEPTVTTLVCSLPISHARLRVHQTPGIPHALHRAEPTCTTRAHPRRENAEAHAAVIATSTTLTQPVIPGRCAASSPESITPVRGYGFRACAKAHPRCAIAHRGMTLVRISLPSPNPSLRAQRSNPPSLRMCHGLLRFARNDDGWTALLRCHRTSTREFSRLFATKSTAVVPHKRSAMRDP
jgi:hypothetical protein